MAGARRRRSEFVRAGPCGMLKNANRALGFYRSVKRPHKLGCFEMASLIPNLDRNHLAKDTLLCYYVREHEYV